MQITKFLHETRQNVAGRFSCVSLCGRLVNRLSLTSGEAVTCPKCKAKQVAETVTTVEV